MAPSAIAPQLGLPWQLRYVEDNPANRSTLMRMVTELPANGFGEIGFDN